LIGVSLSADAGGGIIATVSVKTEGKRATGDERDRLLEGSKVLGEIYVCRNGRLINQQQQ
jgi:hypothetical protein